jgi:outer membrane protein OmpA-like peptidoglycan-associated protein
MKPVVAVEYDNTAGAAVNAERTSAVNMILNAGFAQSARLLVDTIGNDVANSDQIVNTQLQAEGPNTLFRQSDTTCKRRGITEALKIVNRRARTGPRDLLGALQSLASNLTGLTRRHVEVVIFSNMLNSAAPLNFTNPRTFTAGDAHLLSIVANDGLLPSCTGWDVYVVGAGDTTSGVIPDGEYNALREFWSAFFDRCGGQLVLYGNNLTQFPVTSVSTPESKGKSQSSISQRQRTNADGQIVVTFSLRASVLFATGSSTLAKSDATTLHQLFSLLTATYPRGWIDVTGYTDSTPTRSPGGNLSLSRERAAAVARWLTSHGVASRRVRSSGLGESHPIASNATPQGRARNRRVEVTVTLPKGAPRE